MLMDMTATKTNVMQSVRSLLADAIDYAGLFPPAGLSMPEAVINYATYRTSNYNWMLGRFVVTAARLDEFYESARDFISRDNATAWRVSVVVGGDIDKTIRMVEEFNREAGPKVLVDMLEIKANGERLIEDAAQSLPVGVRAYFEIPCDVKMPDLVAAISMNGQRAKIRMGGVTPESFPQTSDVIRFVRACLAANVPFKATAGLHHPIRCFSPLTYEANSLKGTMHGFLNLFLMTGFAREGYRTALLEDVMEEEFSEVFRVDDQIATWRDDYSLNVWQIDLLRQKGIQSFGSCSFDEPIADLQKLGFL